MRRHGLGSEAVDLDDLTQLRRRRHTLVAALTFVTGSADAMGFLMLGGAFSSVMTGNMVLLGLSIGHQEAALAATSATAIASYIIGVVLGARLAGTPKPDDPVWPRSVSRALAVELAIFAVFLVIWESTTGGRSSDLKLIMLAVAASALGIQGSAVQRFGMPGLSSTYLTGTLTTVIGSLASRQPVRSVLPSLKVLSMLVFGSGVAAVCTTHLELLAPLLLVVPLAIVVVESTRITRSQTANTDRENHGTVLTEHERSS